MVCSCKVAGVFGFTNRKESSRQKDKAGEPGTAVGTEHYTINTGHSPLYIGDSAVVKCRSLEPSQFLVVMMVT